MLKKSIVASLTASAINLPAVGLSETVLENKTENYQNQSPQCKEPLDLKTLCKKYIQQGMSDEELIKKTQEAINQNNLTEQAAGSEGEGSKNKTPDLSIESAASGSPDLSVESNAAKGTDLTVEGDTSGSGSLTVEGDSSGTGEQTADNASSTDSQDESYNPDSIFGAESKIFTRITKPVKNLFADIMVAQNKLSHHNQQYNFYPFTPDPFVSAMTINAYFEIPFTEKMDIKAKFERDSVTSATPVFYTITGASPQFNVAQEAQNLATNGNPNNVQQGVTGASVFDMRNAGSVNFNYYGQKATAKVEVGASKENDYTSGYALGELDISFNDNNSTLIMGFNYTGNSIYPNQLGAIVPRESGKNHSIQALGGITQLLNAKSLAQFVVTYFYDKGFMNDPYKPDLFPPTRLGWSFAGRYLKYIQSFHESGLDLSMRYYTDNWGISSYTARLALKMAFEKGWGVEPGIRYYSQNGSKYYHLLVPLNRNQYYTSDYRYASYGQGNAFLEVNKQISETKTMYIGGNYGLRRASWRLGGTQITFPNEQEFTKLQLYTVYIGIKLVY